MADFVENFKKGAERALDGAENVTKAAIKKTSETVGAMKLKYSVRDIEKSIDGIYKELGRKIYNEFSEGAEFEGEYRELCEKVSGYYEEIDVLKVKLAELTNKRVCPECGAYTDPSAHFCSACGAEFDDADEE